MTPIYQTRFGRPFGNCTEACLATLLGLPLEAIPVGYVGDGSGWKERAGGLWTRALNEDLAAFGVRWLTVQMEHIDASYLEPPTPCVLSGPSPRDAGDGMQHAVVGLLSSFGRWEIVHDPHPDGSGLAAVERVGLLLWVRR